MEYAWREPASHSRLLSGKDDGETVEVGNRPAVDMRIKRKEAGLMGEQLSDRCPFLAPLREFRPVAADRLFVVE